MPTISSLYVELKLLADNFNNGIKAAQKEAKEFEKTLRPSKELLEDWGTTASAAGVLVLGAMFAATKATADYADHINDLSKISGVSTEQLSKLGFAAEQSGSSMDGVATGLKILAKNMELANAGGKAQVAAFQAAGISARDLKAAHGDVNQILLKLADTFHDSTDGAGKSAIALTLLGKSGTELIPTLNEGSAGLKELGDQAERAGRVVSTEAGAAADNFNDSLGILTGSVQGLVGTIGQTMLPIFQDLIQALTPIVQGISSWAGAHPELIKAIAGVAVALAGTGGLLLAISGVMAILPALTTAFAVIVGPITLTIAAVAALAAGIIYFRNEIGTVLTAALATVITGLESLIGGAAALADAVGMNGLSDKLRTAQFQLGTFREKLDASVVAGMAQTMTIEATQKALLAEKDERVKSTDVITKHTLTLDTNTDAAKESEKSYKDFIKVWTDAFLVIDKNTASVKNYVDNSAKMHAAYQDAVLDSEKLQDVQIDLAGTLNKTAQAANIKFLMTVDPQTQANIDAFGDQLKKQADDAKKAAEAEAKALQDAINDVKRSAGAVFDDMLLKGQNVFTSLKDALTGGLLSLGRAIFEDIAGALLGPVKKAFDDFFTGLMEGAVGDFVKKVGEKLGDVLGSVLGIGGSAAGVAGTAASGAAGAAGSAASGAAGAGGAAGQAATGSITSLIDTISGIAGALGSIAGAFGTMRLEGTMNAVEYNTRALNINVDAMINQILWPIKGVLEFTDGRIGTMVNQLDAIWISLEGIRGSGGMIPSAAPVAPAIIPVAPPAAPIPTQAPTGGGIVLQPTVYPSNVTVNINNPTGDGAQIADDFLGAIESNGDLRNAFRDMFGRPI